MTVSIETTSRKYRGRKAATYEQIRKKQERWHEENTVVERWLTQLHPRSVLDVPVGTGRFFGIYKKLGVLRVAGVDCSDEMLALARKKLRGETVLTEFKHGYQALDSGDGKKRIWYLQQGDARNLKDFKKLDVAVCVRFLDLIDEKAMHQVVNQLCDHASYVICTIRFGEKYKPKSNTAEHDRKKFMLHLTKLGFAVEEEHPIFNQGWNVLLLKRRGT